MQKVYHDPQIVIRGLGNQTIFIYYASSLEQNSRNGDMEYRHSIIQTRFLPFYA